MRFVDNVGRVVTRSSSFLIAALGSVLIFAGEAMPYVADRMPWWLPPAVLAASALARLVKQRSISGDDR